MHLDELIHLTKKFLIQEKEEGRHFFFKNSEFSLPMSSEIPTREEKIPQSISEKENFKNSESILSKPTKTPFLLEPIPLATSLPFSEMEALVSNAQTKITKKKETEAFVCAFEKGASRDFLEKVTQAISQFMRAELIDVHSSFDWDALLRKKTIKWLLLPASQAEKIVPLQPLIEKKSKAHTILKGYVPLLLLADYEEYVQNIALKQELWSLLKNTLRS